MREEMFQLLRRITGLDNFNKVDKCEVHADGITVTFFAERGVDEGRPGLYRVSSESAYLYDVFYGFDEGENE